MLRDLAAAIARFSNRASCSEDLQNLTGVYRWHPRKFGAFRKVISNVKKVLVTLPQLGLFSEKRIENDWRTVVWTSSSAYSSDKEDSPLKLAPFIPQKKINKTSDWLVLPRMPLSSSRLVTEVLEQHGQALFEASVTHRSQTNAISFSQVLSRKHTRSLSETVAFHTAKQHNPCTQKLGQRFSSSNKLEAMSSSLEALESLGPVGFEIRNHGPK